MLIVYISNGPGWEPITQMANLAAELLDAELLVLDSKCNSFLAKIKLLLFKRKKQNIAEKCLLIVPNGIGLLSLSRVRHWNKRFSFIAAWVIDSFWIEHISKASMQSHHFDHLFITTEEDISAWNDAMTTPVTWLPWGSDVLRHGSNNPERAWDLTRIGREPPEWDDDENTKKLCAELNIRFHGRLKGADTAEKNQAILMNQYQQSKFVLAFSNTAHFMPYTHPTRQYITARWTDAIACGATVAGIAPNEPSINRLLWEGATLDLKSVRIEQGLEVLAEAIKSWKPEQAIKNHQYALERLDWRWRIAEIAVVFDESPPKLNNMMKLLKQKIADGRN